MTTDHHDDVLRNESGFDTPGCRHSDRCSIRRCPDHPRTRLPPIEQWGAAEHAEMLCWTLHHVGGDWDAVGQLVANTRAAIATEYGESRAVQIIDAYYTDV